MKYHLVHHRLHSSVGHRYHEATGFRDECRRRGYAFQLYMSEKADAAVRTEFSAGRAVLGDPVFDPHISFEQRTAMFTRMLHDHLDTGLTVDDRVIVTVATQCESRAFTRWLHDLPEERRPWVAVFMISDRWNFTSPMDRDRQYAEWRMHSEELASLASAERKRLIFAAATEELTNEIGRLLRVRVLAMPTPMPFGTARRVAFRFRRPGAPRRIGVLGGMRPEKGSILVPEIVRLIRSQAKVGFIVQLFNETLSASDFATLEPLRSAPGVRTFDTPGDYERMLQDADVLLLPYEQLPYRNRTSGVFLEGAAHGKLVAVPGGTWMARQIESGQAAGVVFREQTPEHIADAVIACLRAYPDLRQKARGLMHAWRLTQCVSAFMDQLESEITSRSRR